MRASKMFENIYNYFENRTDKTFEILAFLLYIAGLICMSLYHEPWFDEFQALQISKSSIHDILFVIPHMEGHPPLWHLILKFTSIFTSNPELCIKIPNIIFATLAAWLLIFKSPFGRMVRLILPFTYFIFYQYGVISRPYSMLMFALFLIAYLYPKKNEKPFWYGLGLGLLCLSSCYGIVIAFAITLVWLIEIWNKQKFTTFIKSFIVDKRFYVMLGLFLLCLFIFFEIYPVTNDVARAQFYYCPVYQGVLYVLFGLISDIVCSNIAMINNISQISFINVSSIISMCIGAYITYLIFKYFLKNNFLLFILTYLLLIAFMYFGYFYQHHIGIVDLLLIFNFWCSYYKDGESQKIHIGQSLKILIAIALIIQLYWSGTALVNELKYNYSGDKMIATYLRENNIAHNYKIFCSWWYDEKYLDKDGHEIKRMTDITQKKRTIEEIVIKDVFSHQPSAVGINTYFGENIFYNFNVFNPEYSFALCYDKQDITKEKVFAKWRALGEPDIIFASPHDNIFYIMRNVHPELKKIKFPWERVYGDDFDIRKNYIVIKSFTSGPMWKAERCKFEVVMYVKKSLFDVAKTWK